MQLIKVKINPVLLLESFSFKDSFNNIDYLNEIAAHKLATNLEEALQFMNMATYKIEKFHSFFHFEQSYFHLQLALCYYQENNYPAMIKELEAAIFQDPLNNKAKQLLKLIAEAPNYQRQYKNFADYIKFATEEEGEHSPANSYWDDYLVFQRKKDKEILSKIIEKIRDHHLNYHQESAKLYINRAIIFNKLGQVDLAKNDLVKAHCLDSKLREKEYFIGYSKLYSIK